MYLPVSGLEIHPLLPPLISFVVSFVTSMGGVSGAFVLLPVQVSGFGFTSPAVSATNHLYNVVAIPGGVYRYMREGRMVWPLTWAVIVGTLPGVCLGAFLRIRFLPDPRHFKMFVAAVLAYIASRMVLDLVRGRRDGARVRLEPEAKPGMSGVTVLRFDIRRIAYRFEGEVHEAPTLGIGALCLVVGIVGGTYGIGGGSIVAPFFVAVFGLPVHTIAGAALMGTFVTSVAGVVFYQAIAPFYPDLAVAPDWILGLLFGLGGLAGTYLGARTQRFMPARAIKGILAACLLFVVGKYVVEFLG